MNTDSGVRVRGDLSTMELPDKRFDSVMLNVPRNHTAFSTFRCFWVVDAIFDAFHFAFLYLTSFCFACVCFSRDCEVSDQTIHR